MRIKLSKLFLISALAASAMLTCGTAHAAETINVPFEFTAQGHSFPSGSYTVEQNSGKHLVTLHQLKGDATLNWTMGPGSESNGGHVLMNFGRSANGTYVLNAILFGRRFSLEGSPFQNAPARHAALRD
ncbi:MAG TPA: hypothetical protein VGL22_12515 [Terracidiphilus sp.]|jgi:hypothetical protein